MCLSRKPVTFFVSSLSTLLANLSHFTQLPLLETVHLLDIKKLKAKTFIEIFILCAKYIYKKTFQDCSEVFFNS